MGDELFCLEKLSEIVETILFTSSVRDESPVSVIIVGPSGSAKSKLIKLYQGPNIHVTDSITSQGLWEIVQRDPKNEKQFILIPDINPTLSRRTATAISTVSNLLTITADGSVRIDDGRGDKICNHAPMGLITACTPEIYHRHAKQWFALGLVRRIIPLFFTYTSDTTSELQTYVTNGKIHASFGTPRTLKLPSLARPSLNGANAEVLESHSYMFSNNLGKLSFVNKGSKKWAMREIVPISPHVTLRTLAMAHALRRRSAVVGEEETQFVKMFLGFTDPEKPRQV